jgi:hypothetical protein
MADSLAYEDTETDRVFEWERTDYINQSPQAKLEEYMIFCLLLFASLITFNRLISLKSGVIARYPRVEVATSQAVTDIKSTPA